MFVPVFQLILPTKKRGYPSILSSEAPQQDRPSQHVSPPHQKLAEKQENKTYLAPILVGSAMGTSASWILSSALPFALLVALELAFPLAPLDEINLAELLFFSEGGSPTAAPAIFDGPLRLCCSFEFDCGSSSAKGGGSVHPFPSLPQRYCTISSASPNNTTCTMGKTQK
jgi:hypothetical protein